ncbi:hypothetical protein FSP39_006941 [Pinctada imbricata]|uniref:Protein kinase domain-containing protein n=1 Tax=Pinctada imbricata TaxID=66713 RepID=A0AA88XVP9_PINIB|nr:hypothetical protein FSP39_006941 [Pinctada imbricata]
MIDSGGTRREWMDSDSLSQTHFDKYSIFESHLRKLMEKSTEDGLDVSKIQNTAPFDVSYSENLIHCDDFVNIKNRTYLASGWTKAVYKGVYKGKNVAIKTVDVKGQDVSTCMAKGHTFEFCYNKAAQKIVKEIIVLQALANDNVIQVLGFCVPGIHSSLQGVAMVTELGDSVDLIRLLQMSWEDRLRISLDLTRILNFMTTNPYGSMAMNDFRRQQFILVGGKLKLSDVDDVGFGDPSCNEDKDCDIVFSSANFSRRGVCRKYRCHGYNEKRNIFNGGRHFTTFLLPHGAPELLRPLVRTVVDAYSNVTMKPKQILAVLERIVLLYSEGKYLNRTTKDNSIITYRILRHHDLPGIHDYRCRMSLSGFGCTLSVFDPREAQDICDLDEECQGFVMSKVKTWSGRILVHLKSGNSPYSLNNNTDLYLKQSRNKG